MIMFNKFTFIKNSKTCELKVDNFFIETKICYCINNIFNIIFNLDVFLILMFL